MSAHGKKMHDRSSAQAACQVEGFFPASAVEVSRFCDADSRTGDLRS